MPNSSADSSFYGLGTHEWIGRVLPYKSQDLQQKGWAGFGLRRRVAIMGFHPMSKAEIRDDQIVFALVALPTVAGSGAAGRKMSIRISQGDVVLGKFLDGDARQNPIILHVLGRSQDIEYGSGRFDSKTGFVGSIKPNNLNPPYKGDRAQEFNTDVQEGTPSALDPTTKQNRSKEKAVERLQESGISTTPTVGAIPTPPIKLTGAQRAQEMATQRILEGRNTVTGEFQPGGLGDRDFDDPIDTELEEARQSFTSSGISTDPALLPFLN